MYQFNNNQIDQLSAPITDTATEIFVLTPIPRPVPTRSRPFLATLVQNPDLEIVWMYGAEDVGGGVTKFLVIRGAEGTVPKAFSDIASLQVRFTAKAARLSQPDHAADVILTQAGEVLMQNGRVLTFDDVSFAATTI